MVSRVPAYTTTVTKTTAPAPTVSSANAGLQKYVRMDGS